MQRQTRKWLIFTLLWYIILFIVIPLKRKPRLSPFGFWLGFVQSVLLNWSTVRNHKLWKLPGDILLAGVPILTSLSWIPPAIFFANFFPANRGWRCKAVYIMLFAAGATLVQRFLRLAGMWQHIKWKDLYTFPLALITHSLMALSLPFFKIKTH